MENETKDKDNFEEISKQQDPSIVKEFWSFLLHNKKWWLLPIIIIFLLLGLLIVLGGTALAPFIYPLF